MGTLLNEVLSLNAQESMQFHRLYSTNLLLNEVLSLNAQEFKQKGAETNVSTLLNEVLSLNAQEFCLLLGVGVFAWSSMKS